MVSPASRYPTHAAHNSTSASLWAVPVQCRNCGALSPRRKAALQPQPASLLQLLLATPGQLVTRETIQGALWSDGTLVDYELGVNRCVRQLRAALGDSTTIPRYIRTVPKLGYCFVAVVRTPEPTLLPAADAPVMASSKATPLRPAEEQTSITVLPFANLTGDPQDEYFGDGLAEEITNVLAQIGSLKVIARTSAFAFKGKNEDIRKIADTLGVNHVLEGSIRRLGMRIRVTAQLIHASDGTHISSRRYDREEADLHTALQHAKQPVLSRCHPNICLLGKHIGTTL